MELKIIVAIVLFCSFLLVAYGIQAFMDYCYYSNKSLAFTFGLPFGLILTLIVLLS